MANEQQGFEQLQSVVQDDADNGTAQHVFGISSARGDQNFSVDAEMERLLAMVRPRLRSTPRSVNTVEADVPCEKTLPPPVRFVRLSRKGHK